MVIVYLSIMGNVKRFVDRLDMPTIQLDRQNLLIDVDENYVLVVPTYSEDITEIVSQFINYNDNKSKLIGFVGSGNRNFADKYVFNAKDLSKIYNKPLIFSFEYSGTDADIVNFKREVVKFAIT